MALAFLSKYGDELVLSLALWGKDETALRGGATWERGHLPVVKTEDWLEAHPQDIYVREQYRALKRMLDRPSNPLVNLPG